MGPDPYDYAKKPPEESAAEEKPAEPGETTFETTPSKCPMCGFELQSNWKFCPNCGVSFGLKK